MNTPTTPDKPSLINMEQHGIICVKGPDAAKFLQGQCTCDINLAEQGQILLGAHCTPKGRMICNFIAIKTGENQFGLRMRTDIIESSLESFKKYAAFFKVALSISELTPIAVINPQVANITSLSKTLPIPQQPEAGSSTTIERDVIAHHHNDFFEIWASPNSPLISQLTTHTLCGDPDDVNRYFIEQGITDITAKTQAEYTPQDLNYQLINGVNFKKGCYTGQEIIARMQYRGKLKKHTYLAHISTSAEITVGSTIVDPAIPDKTTGVIVACCPPKSSNSYPDSPHYQVLIITAEDNAQKDDFFIEKYSKAKISWKPLPYAIT